jgi:membrane fusion protein (multidrug efflux system)
LLRRHFFLVIAVVILVVMAVAGVMKLTLTPKGPGGGPGATASAGAGGGPGGGGRGGGGRGPSQVSAVEIQTRTFVDSIDVLGVAKGRQSVTLSAATTQLVEKVNFHDGQSVARGAVLIELKASEQNAGLAQSQAKLAQTRQEYERFRTLGEKGFASKSSIDLYEAAWRSAEADVNAAKARLGDRLIRAPFAGTLGLSDVTPGALVNPGAPIVTLDDISAIRVDFQAPERYLAQIAPGQPIVARVEAYPGLSIQGRVARLDTRIDERTRAITARAEFPNADGRLKPGMMMRVSIPRDKRQSLAAPESAVSMQGDSAFVYVLHSRGPKTMTEQRPVVTGVRQDGFVEIKDGVVAGDRIVADGLNKIQPGQPVTVQAPGGAHAGHRAGPAVARAGRPDA